MSQHGGEVTQLRQAAQHLGIQRTARIQRLAQRQQPLPHGLTTIGQDFAHQQINGLNLVRALINHGYTRITHDLLNTPLADIAMATKDLQTGAGTFKRLLRPGRFEDGRNQAAPLLSLLSLGSAFGMARHIEIDAGLIGQNAPAIHPGTLQIQCATNSRVLDDQVGRIASATRSRHRPWRAHLAALQRIGMGFLPCGIQQAYALQRHVQTRRIHHDKHGIQSRTRPANQPAGRRIKAHHAGRAAVQTHFFLDTFTDHSIERTIWQNLGNQKQRQALGSSGSPRQPRQHEVHDVLGQIMLATRDENLASTDLKALAPFRVSARHCLRAHQPQVTACMCFRQAHGGQPLATCHLAQISGLERLAAMVLEAFICAMQQTRRHGPAMVGGAQPLIQHTLQHPWKTLPAIFLSTCQRWPACLPEILIGLREARRRGDLATCKLHAHLIAFTRQRCHHLAHPLACLLQHLLHQCLIGGGMRRQALQLLIGLEHIKKKKRVIGAGGQIGHTKPAASQQKLN